MLQILMAVALVLGLSLATVGAHPASAAPASAATVVVQIDNPSESEQPVIPNWIAGWALDTAALHGTGIDSVTIYVDGDMTTGRLLGQAKYGLDRADVAAQYGNPAFRASGFVFDLAGAPLASGTTHSFTVVAKSAASGTASAVVSGVTLVPPTNPYPVQPNTMAPYTPAGPYAQQPQYTQPQYTQQPVYVQQPVYAQQPQASYYGSGYYPAGTTGGYYSTPYYGTNYGRSYPAIGGYGTTYGSSFTYGSSLYPTGYATNASSYYYPMRYSYGNGYANYQTGSYAYPYGYPSYNTQLRYYYR